MPVRTSCKSCISTCDVAHSFMSSSCYSVIKMFPKEIFPK